jgi:hypothetical protein
MMKRGALIAAVVLAIGAFACERKHDENKAGETTTTSGTVHEEQSTTGSGYNYQGSPGVTGGSATGTDDNGNMGSSTTGSTTNMGSGSSKGSAAGASTGTDRNVTDVSGAGGVEGTSGSAIERDTTSTYAKDAGVASDFEKKDGGHVAPSTDTSKAKSGDTSGNKSTTLGDGTSGQYTGGKGTYGGKATQGTGEKK